MLLRHIRPPHLALVGFVIVALEGGGVTMAQSPAAAAVAVAADVGDEFGGARVVVGGGFGVEVVGLGVGGGGVFCGERESAG
jgi:hypothetical protein